MSTNLISGLDSGSYKMDAYYTGNGSFFNGSQQYFDHGNDPSTGAYQATFNLYYGATGAGSQSSAFTGTGWFEKTGSGTYVLNQTNSYTGVTSILGGSVQLSGSGTLGTGSNVSISSGANLDLNGVSVTVASVKETGNENGGTISLGSGTLTINGANKGTLYQNSISGAGNLVMAGSGDTSLGLYGTQDYSGNTTVSGGKISSGVTMGTSAVIVSGGEFEMTADDKLADTATLSISSGTLDLQGTDTVASLASTGGAVTLGSGKTLTVTGNSSIGSGSTITGGTLKASGGTLTFNSTSGNTSAVTIDSGATLTGNGTIGGAATIDGTHAPGSGVGTQNFSSTLSYGSGSFFEWDVANTGSDSITATSLNVTSGAIFKILEQDIGLGFWDTPQSWTVFSGTTSGAFSLFDNDGGLLTNRRTIVDQGYFEITQSASGISMNWSPIPEPSTTLAGLLLAAGVLRRKR
jgi:autotransporter-associated beta strand protein